MLSTRSLALLAAPVLFLAIGLAQHSLAEPLHQLEKRVICECYCRGSYQGSFYTSNCTTAECASRYPCVALSLILGVVFGGIALIWLCVYCGRKCNQADASDAPANTPMSNTPMNTDLSQQPQVPQPGYASQPPPVYYAEPKAPEPNLPAPYPAQESQPAPQQGQGRFA
ncbi:hypothetical protein HDU96_008307 [Phlyctochytrium bullatum]|nr:hypothetical protein HDU96_008307 [Phlyctochytrium bullatum]